MYVGIIIACSSMYYYVHMYFKECSLIPVSYTYGTYMHACMQLHNFPLTNHNK